MTTVIGARSSPLSLSARTCNVYTNWIAGPDQIVLGTSSDSGILQAMNTRTARLEENPFEYLRFHLDSSRVSSPCYRASSLPRSCLVLTNPDTVAYASCAHREPCRSISVERYDRVRATRRKQVSLSLRDHVERRIRRSNEPFGQGSD